MRQWLLAIDMLSHLHRHHRRHSMRVVRRAHHHRIERFLRFQHLAEVAVSLGLGHALESFSRTHLIHVANRNDVLATHPLKIIQPFATASDHSDVQLLIR